MLNRKEVADRLKKAGIGYLVKKGFSCTAEIGIMKRGKRKVDVMGLTLKGTIAILEIKSCAADYNTDSKWTEYLPYADMFSFVISDKFYRSKHGKKLCKDAKHEGAGVLVLDPISGWLRKRVPSRYTKIQGRIRRQMITRLAWRAGEFSKRNTRRQRQFLE